MSEAKGGGSRPRAELHLEKKPDFSVGLSTKITVTRTFRLLRRTDNNKEPQPFRVGVQKKGGDILSHRIAVPSAQAGLTSLFGMGRGEPRRNNHLRFLVVSN